VEHPAVAEEDERGPQLDPERPAEPFPRPVLDLDVPDAGVTVQRRRQTWAQVLADRSLGFPPRVAGRNTLGFDYGAHRAEPHAV
jgi:hypothetical protein